MTRGVDEGQELAAPFHLVGTDVLSDAAGLAGDHIRLADAVEQKRLAMVNMAHHGDDRRPYLVVILVLVLAVVAEELGP